ncbi:MAG: hypothetical protein DCF29_17965 [Alphaproteobacteria bacterium]|nr:MAG: hypothetical protein DCF29_17965 [Alphaproteobacteria bacterium]
MGRLIRNLLLLAIIVAGISFFVAPVVAFYGIRSAADARDEQGLVRLIDFAEVRRSLRPQMAGNPAVVAPAPSFLENPIESMRRQFEQVRPVAARPNPDIYLSPAALSALSRGEGRAAARGLVVAEPREPIPRLAYWGVNRTRLAVRDEAGQQTIFTFARTGPFEWRLVHIGLPPVPPSTAAGATR